VTSLGELLGRFDRAAPRAWTARLRKSIADYFRGCEAECNVRAQGRWPKSSEYLAFRDGSIGVYPMLDLIEFSSGIYFDPGTPVEGLSNCRRFAALALAVTNDIHSSRKESEESASFNAVAVLEREYSVSRSIALEMAQRLHVLLRDACVSSIAQARAEHDESALQSFSQGFADWCEGNLRWSAECPRYNAAALANDADLAYAGPGEGAGTRPPQRASSARRTMPPPRSKPPALVAKAPRRVARQAARSRKTPLTSKR
jgi:hypothetical protein